MCAREFLLLDCLRRAKIDRRSDLTDSMLVSDSLTDHVQEYARLVMGKGNVRSCVASRDAYGLKRRFQTDVIRIDVTPEKAIVFCIAIGLERRFGVQKKGTTLVVDVPLLQPLPVLSHTLSLQGFAWGYRAAQSQTQ